MSAIRLSPYERDLIRLWRRTVREVRLRSRTRGVCTGYGKRIEIEVYVTEIGVVGETYRRDVIE